MSEETYRLLFLIAAILSGVMFLVTVLLFFLLKIPKIINDLSGRSARKAIEDIRRQNEASGDKSYQSSAVNLERGKLTDKISRSGRLLTRDQSPFGTGVITEKISTQELPAEETSVLSTQNETTILSAEIGQTANLQQFQPETEIISGQNAFEVEFEITYIHTNEVIA